MPLVELETLYGDLSQGFSAEGTVSLQMQWCLATVVVPCYVGI